MESQLPIYTMNSFERGIALSLTNVLQDDKNNMQKKCYGLQVITSIYFFSEF